MNRLTAYQPRQSAVVVHRALKNATQAMDQAKENALLWFAEVNNRKLYKEFGCSSIHQYAEQELGFGRSKTFDFLRVCQKLDKLPRVKEKVEKGELGIANTVAIIGISNPDNEAEWLEEALNSSNRQLRDKVRKAKGRAAQIGRKEKSGQGTLRLDPEPAAKAIPAAVVPVIERLEFSPTQFARYEKLWEKIRQQGGVPGDKVEAMLEMMAAYVATPQPNSHVGQSARVDSVAQDPQPASGDPETHGNQSARVDSTRPLPSPPVQIHIHQCPDCGQAAVQTNRGELLISQAELEQAQCDCLISQPGEKNKSAIAPKTRRQVLARDRHRCQAPGCHHTQFLQLHHIVPRSAGGGNEAENLVTLCASCHKLLHEKKLAGMVKSPKSVYRAGKWEVNADTCPPAGFAVATDWAAMAYEIGRWHAKVKPALPAGWHGRY